MKNSHTDFFRFGLILAIVCVFSSGSLTFVYLKTKTAIEDSKLAGVKRLQNELFPEAEKFEDESENVKRALGKNGEYLGKVVSIKSQGYGGDIDMRVGIAKDNTVSAVKVLKHKETPGLGTKALTSEFLSQYKGKKSENIFLTKDDQKNGRIDAVTGATITSRAVTSGVRAASREKKSDGVTAATPYAKSISTGPKK